MKEKLAWLRWPLEHYTITLVLIGIIFALGIFGLIKMPKDEFPQITIRQGVLVAVYPGATSEEVEQQVARPLERYLFSFKEVRREYTTTSSQNGLCIAMVELNQDVSDKDAVWSKIKHGLPSLKLSLPSGVLGLVVNDDFGNTSALLIAMESSLRSYRELEDFAMSLSDRLRRIKSVANVKISGNLKEQITLYVDRSKMEAYGLGRRSILTALQTQAITMMSGGISTSENQIPIHIETTLATEEEVANHIVFSGVKGENIVRIRDIATVVKEYDKDQGYIEQNGHPCILLSMEMNPGNNIVAYGAEVDKVLNEFRENEMPSDITITRIADQPKVVSGSVFSFLRDLLISMVIIILVMMLLFPLRSAIVAAITIPLSTFISVAVMYMAGIELNIITLAALIVVLGMVVDNAIVVIDGYLEYLDKGYEPKKAAIESARQYFIPMTLATFCLCTIFYPLLITLNGAGYDALRQFPPTMTINLVVSLVLAVTVIPFLEVKIIKPERMVRKEGEKITDKVQKRYNKILDFTFRHPWKTIVAGFLIILATCPIFFGLKIRMFPFADRNQFAVEIFLPEGKGLNDTRMVADSLRKILQADPDVDCITSFIGCSSPRFMTCYAPQIAGKNYAQFIVNTTTEKASLELMAHYQPMLSEAFPDAYIKFKRMDYLPVPEMEYRFYGDDLDSLSVAAERMMAEMRKMPELEWVHTDFFLPRPVVNITLDPVASAQLGINKAVASLNLSALTGELPVGSVWEDDYEIPLVVKDHEDITASDIENMGMATPIRLLTAITEGKSTIPLRQVATVEPVWSHSRIMHRCGIRCITVTAQFANGVYAAPVEAKLKKIMTSQIELPQGVSCEVGGEKEFENELVPGIFSGILIAMGIVFFFLLFNFKKYGMAMTCIVALTFMLPGTFVGLALVNKTLGLTAVLGVITLMGMIMRNEILIFEHANDLVKKFVDEHPGYSIEDYNEAVKHAAYDAGKRRMVPIFLTTATTAVGVVPMILGGSSFWMPVGATIFAGGIGALILLVSMLPVIYWKVNTK